VIIAGDNTRATITAIGGAEFEVNDDGLFTVEVHEVPEAGGRRLNGFFKKFVKNVGRELSPSLKSYTTGNDFNKDNLGDSMTFVATDFASTMEMMFTDPLPASALSGGVSVPATAPAPKPAPATPSDKCYKYDPSAPNNAGEEIPCPKG
jgi:hypothetical protein